MMISILPMCNDSAVGSKPVSKRQDIKCYYLAKGKLSKKKLLTCINNSGALLQEFHTFLEFVWRE